LRPEANATGLTGELLRTDALGVDYLRFRYTVVRLWQMPAAPLLEGPLGTATLGLLTGEARSNISEHINRIQERLERTTDLSMPAKELWTSCLLLLGLRYDKEELTNLLKGVRGMRESAGYQMILDEGRVEGRVEGAFQATKDAIRELGGDRFGLLPPEMAASLEQITDLIRLRRIHKRLLKAADWTDLLATP
jgi:hypothetical protein